MSFRRTCYHLVWAAHHLEPTLTADLEAGVRSLGENPRATAKAYAVRQDAHHRNGNVHPWCE